MSPDKSRIFFVFFWGGGGSGLLAILHGLGFRSEGLLFKAWRLGIRLFTNTLRALCRFSKLSALIS